MSLVAGSSTADLRSAITTNFPGVTFSGAPSLTPAYLGTVDAVVISSFVAVGTVTSLSSAEQTALLGFVQAGHGAYIVVDNDTHAGSGTKTQNDTFLTPFGLAAAGALADVQTISITDPQHPLTDGPFGTAHTLVADWPGWFTSLGAAHRLGTLAATNADAAAVLDPGAISPGSGAVVFISDTGPATILHTLAGNDNRYFTLNAIALIVPEPSTASTLFIAAICASTGRRRRQRSV
jgi:hypothetical protein